MALSMGNILLFMLLDKINGATHDTFAPLWLKNSITLTYLVLLFYHICSCKNLNL